LDGNREERNLLDAASISTMSVTLGGNRDRLRNRQEPSSSRL
jgi:hypothetical protein